MKCWLNNPRFRLSRSENGIALVITLIMLAIVTVMAIIFLSLSRRERASVKVSEDIATANMAADAALERAKAQAIAQMEVSGSMLHYDLFNSTNFISPNGFKSQADKFPDPSNVDYFDNEGNLLPAKDRLQVIANLQYDPRAPVFIETNTSGPNEFRYYLDFNRNRVFEPNGFLPEINTNGQFVLDAFKNRMTNRFVGDPEWIGILERPDLPHSETNRMIARMAYLALPVGKTLDLNFIHNQADMASGDDDLGNGTRSRVGFTRNQGYGSWEINMAAFLRELNTNNYGWPNQSYNFKINQPSTGTAFEDALAMLNFRYNGRRSYLSNSIGTIGLNHFANDFIDNYANGPIYLGPTLEDNDDPTRPWPGSLNTNAFTDVQQLFTFGNYSTAFTNRLEQTMALQRKSTYDRYTYYRLLSQIGVDSDPAIKGKLNLNYENSIGEVTNNFIPWTNSVAFFTNAADLMLKASIEEQVRNIRGANYTNFYLGDTPVRSSFALTNILVYEHRPLNIPTNVLWITNEYTAATHRVLQLAVNIYDNMTNVGTTYPYFPTVLRPYFRKTSTNVTVAGFLPVTNINQISGLQWINPMEWVESQPGVQGIFTNVNLYGQPFIVGVKKGHPNFNEFSLETVAEVTRKLELGKATPGGAVTITNQQYVVGLQTRLGVEAWNSYRTNYTRPVHIFAEVFSNIGLSNKPAFSLNEVRNGYFTNYATSNMNVADWRGYSFDTIRPGNMRIPIYTNTITLRDSVYTGIAPNYFAPITNSLFQPLSDAPNFKLYTTNRVKFWITDLASGAIVDFVNLGELKSVLDIGSVLRPNGRTALVANNVQSDNIFWDTNRVGASSLTAGMTNQIAMSLGELTKNPAVWKQYSKYLPNDLERSIALFRVFSGTNQGDVIREPILPDPASTRHQAPFSPTKRIYVRYAWQANDPLVHYMNTDLAAGDAQGITLPAAFPQSLDYSISISNLWNIGDLNQAFKPWGGQPGKYANKKVSDTNKFNIGLKDPNIWVSDDWRFPIVQSATNYLRFPNIGWLGRVHRGSPWQTVFMKPIILSVTTNRQNQITPVALVDANMWYLWAHSAGTFPSMDYKLFDLFTIAPNDNAARGLLSVNQAGQASWAAVLGGITVYTNNLVPDKQLGDPETPMNMVDAYTKGYSAEIIQPATGQISNIVANINYARSNQWDIAPYTDGRLPGVSYKLFPKTIAGTTNRLDVFEHLGDVLNSPALSTHSPFLRRTPAQMNKIFVDEAVERIPQQIMSLLKRDEPKFVVYSFGQSLKPAPHSLVTSPDFYNLCTNYQITGEVITKTTFRVEGELRNPNNPLRAVVESYNVLPPPE